MLDMTLLAIAGFLAGGAILMEEELAVRLAVAISFGGLVAMYFWLVLPYHRGSELPEELDIFS